MKGTEEPNEADKGLGKVRQSNRPVWLEQRGWGGNKDSVQIMEPL